MSNQQVTELDAAQKFIYTRTNIRRAFNDFDDTDIADIYLQGEDCLILRRDGSQQTYNREPIKVAYTSYTHRLKDFFSYLGPNYRGPSVWHNNAYVLFKGWYYSHALGHLTPNARLQAAWADRFIHLNDVQKVTALLQSDQADLGHLIAPDGLRAQDMPIDFNSSLDTVEDVKPIFGEPWCSCGSYQQQLNNISSFSQEIEGFKPWCIHLSWFNKYREMLSKRTEARNQAPNGTPSKCVAWWYQPPSDHLSDGLFKVLYTTYGAQAPVSHWRNYKPDEHFTQNHAWDLFFNMMEAGYVPFPGRSLPQLQSVVKKQ